MTGAPVEEELGWMKPFSKFSEMHSEKEVSLLSPWRIHPNTGDKQREPPSSWFLLLPALPLNPTTPPGSHYKMKGGGPYSQRRDKVKIENYFLQHLESLEDNNDILELIEGIWTEDGNDGVLESPTRAAHDSPGQILRQSLAIDFTSSKNKANIEHTSHSFLTPNPVTSTNIGSPVPSTEITHHWIFPQPSKSW
ncbi:hypothetical protein O181_045433 [Austropuccinia psidii MF-1]|uniref:Uncharacterized protein n=1 Tax=Austropuccinia psidii MF-1 TaxID=1389203 RepID=A0A9Q3HHL6_9BASI|nr:hypothetical protein [Austropuccinia psidii MF-1]